MNYLSVQQVLFLHYRLIAETGGAHGLRDLGLLESAVARPWASYAGSELHSDLFAKAAALLDSLIRNHAFLDGNKRTGVAAASLFLRRNGWRLTLSNEELEALALRVAASAPCLEEIAAILRAHSEREQ
ncbi:MAG: type II toxin-antitoxin system death-on-curing family toxin [Anaerolineae bacterium]